MLCCEAGFRKILDHAAYVKVLKVATLELQGAADGLLQGLAHEQSI